MMAETMAARWVVTEDADMIGLRVDLWNGYAVHVLAWKDDSIPPGAMLRGPESAHDLDEMNARQLRAWLDQAQGRGGQR
jgi:hypothetical protein